MDSVIRPLNNWGLEGNSMSPQEGNMRKFSGTILTDETAIFIYLEC